MDDSTSALIEEAQHVENHFHAEGEHYAASIVNKLIAKIKSLEPSIEDKPYKTHYCNSCRAEIKGEFDICNDCLEYDSDDLWLHRYDLDEICNNHVHKKIE